MTEPGGIPTAYVSDDKSGVQLIEHHRDGSKRVVKSWRSELQRRLQMVATVLTILSLLGGGARWVVKSFFVSRDDWDAFRAELNARLDRLEYGRDR